MRASTQSLLTASLFSTVVGLSGALSTPLLAAPEDASAGEGVDLVRGQVLFRQCALCHGSHGQGILGGKYPRIGGMPDYYIMNALLDYQAGERGYDAMIVVGGLKNLERSELESLAAYISNIDLASSYPIDVPSLPQGDPEEGEDLYRGDCKTCHGREGEGKERKESPPLRSQYPEYLSRQIELFKSKQRIHADDPEDETFVSYTEEELQDILAFITSLDDPDDKGTDD